MNKKTIAGALFRSLVSSILIKIVLVALPITKIIGNILHLQNNKIQLSEFIVDAIVNILIAIFLFIIYEYTRRLYLRKELLEKYLKIVSAQSNYRHTNLHGMKTSQNLIDEIRWFDEKAIDGMFPGISAKEKREVLLLFYGNHYEAYKSNENPPL